MADAKKDTKDPSVTGEPVPVEDADEKGYVGVRENKHPDSAYTLATGPEAPTGENGPE